MNERKTDEEYDDTDVISTRSDSSDTDDETRTTIHHTIYREVGYVHAIPDRRIPFYPPPYRSTAPTARTETNNPYVSSAMITYIVTIIAATEILIGIAIYIYYFPHNIDEL